VSTLGGGVGEGGRRRRRRGGGVGGWCYIGTGPQQGKVKLATNGTMRFITSRGSAAGRWCLQQQLMLETREIMILDMSS